MTMSPAVPFGCGVREAKARSRTDKGTLSGL